eukprot:5958848-Amphidinium_carterae.1
MPTKWAANSPKDCPTDQERSMQAQCEVTPPHENYEAFLKKLLSRPVASTELETDFKKACAATLRCHSDETSPAQSSHFWNLFP